MFALAVIGNLLPAGQCKKQDTLHNVRKWGVGRYFDNQNNLLWYFKTQLRKKLNPLKGEKSGNFINKITRYRDKVHDAKLSCKLIISPFCQG